VPAYPKKPLNVFFRFRAEKYVELKDDDDKPAKIKVAWENIDPDYKAKLEAEFKVEVEAYQEATAAWREKHGSPPKK